ncbi:DNA/RNA helicase, superfamily II, SNF2 family [Slackia heliotrinireducens DSM 20476]|uniref:DNA/RNA helicase, superfamily II, SNF2 family n=2 Tax=Slackia TaxID=84108 RepID=C7N643_SLAHD|nr:DNA/RNA helicase, superfamily II, SNF2 family [Slackia heliotrinireducens DSM 20476]
MMVPQEKPLGAFTKGSIMLDESRIRKQVSKLTYAEASALSRTKFTLFTNLSCGYKGLCTVIAATVATAPNASAATPSFVAVKFNTVTGDLLQELQVVNNVQFKSENVSSYGVALALRFVAKPEEFEGHNNTLSHTLPHMVEMLISNRAHGIPLLKPVRISIPDSKSPFGNSTLSVTVPEEGQSFQSMDWVRDVRHLPSPSAAWALEHMDGNPGHVMQFYFDANRSGRIWCDARVLSGGRKRGLLDAVSAGPDRDHEEQAYALLNHHDFEHCDGEEFFLKQCTELDQLMEFVTEGVKDFSRLGEVFVTDLFKRISQPTPMQLQVGVSVESGLLNVRITGDEVPDEDINRILHAYRLKKKFHRLSNGRIVRLDDESLQQVYEIADDLGLDDNDLMDGQAKLPGYKALLLPKPGEHDRGYATQVDDSVGEYLARITDVQEAEYQVPIAFTGTLRPYQQEGFAWLNSRMENGFGGAILADQMGLGKTAQTIVVMVYRRNTKNRSRPCMVVCPSSLVQNWLAEFERFAPDMDVVAAVGPRAKRALDIAHAVEHDVLVTSYDALWRDIELYDRSEFDIIALDEANRIKNPATKSARACKRLKGEGRIAITGTPVENRLSELYSIMDFCIPGMLARNYEQFRSRYETPIVRGNEEATSKLKALVEPFILRRLTREVLTDLPELVESVHYAPMTVEQSRLYHAREQRLQSKLAERDMEDIQLLAEITRLRQVCCDPGLVYEDYDGGSGKLDAIVNLVEQAREVGSKTVIFSQWVSFLESISKRLNRNGIAHDWIIGDTPASDRVGIVDAFNKDETPVLLVSMRAGGVGLNMTGASTAIIADPFWHEAAQTQAYSRLWRLGQDSSVFVYQIIAENTIEDRILGLQHKKHDLGESVISAGAASMPNHEELIELVSGR